MSGKQIDALPHSCGSQTGLKVFLDSTTEAVNGWCFSCKEFVENPYGEPKTSKDITLPPQKSVEQIQSEIAEVGGYPVVDIVERRLRAQTLEKFGAKVSMSEFDGKTPTAIYWPLTKGETLLGYHVKFLQKNKNGKKLVYNLGSGKEADLINWRAAKKSGAYRLIVTEGPEDMASVDRIYELYGNKEEYHPAVCSLPAGAGSAKSVLLKHAEEINRLFKEVILCFDNDTSGKRALEDAMLVLPKAKAAILPYKDANECLVNQAAKAAYNALAFQTSTPKNSSILRGYTVHELAKEPARWGELSWPWSKIQDDMRGIRLGENTYIGAAQKMGKSTIKNALVAHFIKNDKTKVFMACPEEPVAKGYKLLATQLTGKIYHDPKIPFDYESFEEAGKLLKENLYQLSLYQFMGWKSLKEDIKEAVHEGCQAVIIDPITSLTAGVGAGETNTMLEAFAVELAAMSKDLNFHAFLFCHLKANDTNLSEEKRQKYYEQGKYTDLGPVAHTMGGSIYSDQFTGSRAMARSCHLMLGLMGNKDPDLSDEIRNTRELVVLEDREFGNNQKYKLFYNKNTGQFKDL